ncbi:glycosyltransferase family 1 protein [uncultured Sphingomonas sp.]|uniref:glycosyltransferase family 4 protein n=1 Tax=uncultured Sphingomonas sp. TaxID=158754 RepID=UPI0025CD68FE|nr:glycosyltransferase family 1 protein [uncultured Sphingomonas sp.]
MTRHWALNGRFLGQSRTGVQRYAWEILHELDRHLAERHGLADQLAIDLVVPPDVEALPRLHAIRTCRTSAGRGHLWEQAVLPLHARNGLISLTNTGPLLVRKHILCIHDLNTRSFPQSYSRSFRWLYRLLMPALGRSARTVTTVSHYSAGQLAAHGVCRRDKIIVVPNGHEHVRQWTPQHTEASAKLAGRDTIVLIGSPAPHKNVGIVLSLAGRLEAAGLRVALVGHADPGVFRGAGASHAANVHHLGRLPDPALAALLRDGLCLAFPSFVEGFGLPPLEAMAVGCPVVTSDRTSLPEVCESAALYASPDDPEAWFNSLLQLRHDPALRDALVARGRAQAMRFTWSRSALLYLHTMAVADGWAGERVADASPLRCGVG